MRKLNLFFQIVLFIVFLSINGMSWFHGENFLFPNIVLIGQFLVVLIGLKIIRHQWIAGLMVFITFAPVPIVYILRGVDLAGETLAFLFFYPIPLSNLLIGLVYSVLVFVLPGKKINFVK